MSNLDSPLNPNLSAYMWEETGVPVENPHKHSHRKSQQMDLKLQSFKCAAAVLATPAVRCLLLNVEILQVFYIAWWLLKI